MARTIVYFAHPAQRHSQANRAMARRARQVVGVTWVDLYAEYPRFEIDVDLEQRRLLDHDVVLLQYPMFWYSTPALIKEWQDLVLEHGFAYGHGGTCLAGKSMMLALTAGGPPEAYAPQGYQRFDLRTFLTPLEQTARLCGMRFLAPYVLFSSIRASDEGRMNDHAEGYASLLVALRDDTYDLAVAEALDVVGASTLPLRTTV